MKVIVFTLVLLMLLTGCERPVRLQNTEADLFLITGSNGLDKRLAKLAKLTEPRQLANECNTVAVYFSTSIAFVGDAEPVVFANVGLGRDQLLEATQSFVSKFLGAKPRVERLSGEYVKKFGAFDLKAIKKSIEATKDPLNLIKKVIAQKQPKLLIVKVDSVDKQMRIEFAKNMADSASFGLGASKTKLALISDSDSSELNTAVCELFMDSQPPSDGTKKKPAKITLPPILFIDADTVPGVVLPLPKEQPKYPSKFKQPQQVESPQVNPPPSVPETADCMPGTKGCERMEIIPIK